MALIFKAGTIESLTDTAEVKDWIVLDLGFSSQHKSCGLIVDGKKVFEGKRKCKYSCTYAEAVAVIVERIKSHDKEEPLHLVLEAPLSYRFNKNNPCARDTFEEGRGWYHGAGASVCLGAQFILKRIAKKAADSNATIFLYEGFISFKSTKNQTGDKKPKFINNSLSTHGFDALLLKKTIEALKANKKEKKSKEAFLPKDSLPLSDLLGQGFDFKVPLIIKPSEKRTEKLLSKCLKKKS